MFTAELYFLHFLITFLIKYWCWSMVFEKEFSSFDACTLLLWHTLHLGKCQHLWASKYFQKVCTINFYLMEIPQYETLLIIKPSNLHWTIGSLVNCNFYVTAFRCKFLPDYLHTIYFTNFKLLSIYITIDQMDFFCIPSSYSLEILLILKYFELVFKNMYIFWKSWCNVIWFNMFWFCWRN